MKLALDTNAYSALRRGHPEVADLVRRAERILMSTVVVGELQFGFRNGSRYERNWRELRAFLDQPFVNILEVTLVTADRFGRISTALRTKGKPIPTNDIWIAAHAMEHGADLLTFDEHFEIVECLALIRLSPKG